jgi:hypothetical protein
MKILWITKIASSSLTGGTKVSYNYREELKNSSNVDICAKICETENKKMSFFQFCNLISEKMKGHYDVVIFDDHYSFFSLLFLKNKKILFYHGNWPDLMFTSISYFLKGLFLFPQYLIGMFFSDFVIFVNPIFEKKFSKFVKKSVTLFNPINPIHEFKNYEIIKDSIVLVGNIDARKYGNLIIFLDKNPQIKNPIHIYGKVIENSIANKLKTFTNISLMGYIDVIPYKNYEYHLSFSKSENLPLALFEALIMGLSCTYPKLENYKFLEDKRIINFYEDFNDLFFFLNSDIKLVTNEDDLKFIPRSYRENVTRIKDIINQI